MSKPITPLEVQEYLLRKLSPAIAKSYNGNNGSGREFVFLSAHNAAHDMLRYVAVVCSRKEAKMQVTFYADLKMMSHTDGCHCRRASKFPFTKLEDVVDVIRKEAAKVATASTQAEFEANGYTCSK